MAVYSDVDAHPAPRDRDAPEGVVLPRNGSGR